MTQIIITVALAVLCIVSAVIVRNDIKATADYLS